MRIAWLNEKVNGTGINVYDEIHRGKDEARGARAHEVVDDGRERMGHDSRQTESVDVEPGGSCKQSIFSYYFPLSVD